MSFIPPGENILEKKICPITGKEFVITEEDAKMYDMLSPVIGGKKLLIPSPTLCPEERQVRRMTWRNYDHFYKNTCTLTGKEIISIYRPGTLYKILSYETWWGDSWNALDFGKKIDFSLPFFEQFRKLDQSVYHMPLSFSKSENSAFTNFSLNNKNCYLCSRIAECENCYYSLLIINCKNCFDCSDVNNSEYLYECTRVIKSYNCFYCTDCENCRNSYFLKDCTGCQDCFGSCNLRNAQYIYNNQQLSAEEYKNKLSKTLVSTLDYSDVRENFLHYSEKFPKKYFTGYGNESSLGNYLHHNARVMYGFGCHENDNVRYAFGGVHVKDSVEISFGYFHECSLEICGGSVAYAQLFCMNCIDDCRDIIYCKDCVNGTTNCFGCVSLKKSKNCILNTPYSQQEYETLVTKLIDHMRSTGEWGEFFPAQDSPFSYNESSAQVHFPQSQDWALNRGLTWYNAEDSIKSTGYIPLPISQYTEKIVGYEIAKKNIDTLLSETLYCIDSGKAYRIIGPELAFYIENTLPVPRRHPSVRSQKRMSQTLPMGLYNRSCDECKKAFFTAYSPERPEKILCEECYRKLVY